MKQQLLTQAAYGKYRGVSRQRVGQWLKGGRIELTGGLVDVAAADASLEATEPPTMHERHGRPDPDADEKELLLLVWDNFFAAVAKVWELSRPKRLTKDLMLNFVRHLR